MDEWKRRNEIIREYETKCKDINELYPNKSFDDFCNDKCKEFDRTETGTYGELAKKRIALRDKLKYKYDIYKQHRIDRLDEAEYWFKCKMKDSINTYSKNESTQNRIFEYLYMLACVEGGSWQEIWDNLDDYDDMMYNFMVLLEEDNLGGDKGV